MRNIYLKLSGSSLRRKMVCFLRDTRSFLLLPVMRAKRARKSQYRYRCLTIRGLAPRLRASFISQYAFPSRCTLLQCRGSAQAEHMTGIMDGPRLTVVCAYVLRDVQVAIAGYGSLPAPDGAAPAPRRAAFLVASLAALAMVACVGIAVAGYDQVGCRDGAALEG